MTENGSVVVTARVERGLHREVRLRALARGESLQAVVVAALELYVAADPVLTERDQGREADSSPRDPAVAGIKPPSRSVSAATSATIPEVTRPHMKKNRPAVECPCRVLVDGVCPDCGWETDQ